MIRDFGDHVVNRRRALLGAIGWVAAAGGSGGNAATAVRFTTFEAVQCPYRRDLRRTVSQPLRRDRLCCTELPNSCATTIRRGGADGHRVIDFLWDVSTPWGRQGDVHPLSYVATNAMLALTTFAWPSIVNTSTLARSISRSARGCRRHDRGSPDAARWRWLVSEILFYSR